MDGADDCKAEQQAASASEPVCASVPVPVPASASASATAPASEPAPASVAAAVAAPAPAAAPAPVDEPAARAAAASSGPSELAPGTVIGGRYRVDRRAGDGAMGSVWAGEHLSVGLPVAIKALAADAQQSSEIAARFRREAQLLGRLRSDSVARVIDFIVDERHGMLLVMEFVAGEPLSKVLSSRGRLSVEEVVRLGADLAGALSELHRVHIVHRDLKPANIMLEPRAEGGWRCVLVDFGASRMVSAGEDDVEADDTLTSITRVDMAIGTIEYMAPEQMLNSRDVTEACDLYALGAILYRAVAGEHVFGGISEGKLVRAKLLDDPRPLQTGRTDAMAAGLERVVARALQRLPNERYPSADAMAAELVALRDAAANARPSKPAALMRPPPPELDDDLTAVPFELIPRDAMLVSADELIDDPASDDEPVTERVPGDRRLSGPDPMRFDTVLPPPSAGIQDTQPSAGVYADPVDASDATGRRPGTLPSLVPIALGISSSPRGPALQHAIAGGIAAAVVVALMVVAAVRVDRSGAQASTTGNARLEAMHATGAFAEPARRAATAAVVIAPAPIVIDTSALPDAPRPRPKAPKLAPRSATSRPAAATEARRVEQPTRNEPMPGDDLGP